MCERRRACALRKLQKLCDEIDDVIRKIIPKRDLDNMVDNIGLPYSGTNLSYSNSAPVGPEDADILISLKKGHKPTADYMRKLREILPVSFLVILCIFIRRYCRSNFKFWPTITNQCSSCGV